MRAFRNATEQSVESRVRRRYFRLSAITDSALCFTFRRLGVLILFAGTIAGCALHSSEPSDAEIVAKTLLKTEHTILGQPIVYPPDGPAEVTAVIITIPPGAETGLHRHDAPFFAYLLEGELTVSYKGHGSRVYKAGDSLIEAIGTPHNGRSTGDVPARVLSVFMGVKGAAISIPMELRDVKTSENAVMKETSH